MVRTEDEKKRLDEKVIQVFRTCRGMPKPVTKEWLEEAGKAGMILKKDLKEGAYYYGTCRNARVAQWDSSLNVFWYMRTKFGDVFAEDICHPEDDNGFDLFLPVEEVQPEDQEVIK